MSKPAARHPPVHSNLPIVPDPPHEMERAAELRASCTREQIMKMLDECSSGSTEADANTRRMLWRALVKRMGHSVRIGRGVLIKHPETFEIGDGVFIGDQVIIQGRFDGCCIFGLRCWIGPQTYLDARAIEFEDYAGTAPAARVLSCEHSGLPLSMPFITTELVTRTVLIKRSASVGMGACVMPGVTVGEDSLIGAGAVVTKDVPPRAIVAGVPARVLRIRDAQEKPHA